jgi:hypothetical protein
MTSLARPLCLLLLGAAAAAARAQESASALPGSRTLKAFDFEEQKLGNFETVPMHWSKVVGRGFPAYSAGAFDAAVARSPGTSFRLQTNGGSVAYRFTPPPEKRIPIQPDSDYYVLAFVRTSQLKHARADLAAWFADDAGALLPSTEVHSLPYTPKPAASDPDVWQVLYLYLPGPDGDAQGDAAKARSLVLQMGLLQPQQLSATPAPAAEIPGQGAPAGGGRLGRFEIYRQDIQGSVWFDDLVVFQLPRIGVRVPKTVVGGIFQPPQEVALDLIVSDLSAAATPTPLDIRLRVTDPEGLVLAAERWTAQTSPEKAWTLHYTHPPLPAGCYTATLEVADASGGGEGGTGGAPGEGKDRVLIARRQTRFLCLPAGARATERPAPEFGLGVTLGPQAAAGDAATLWPALARYAGAGVVQLPAWRRDMSEDALTRRDQPFDTLLAALQKSDVRAIGTLAEIPAALAARLPPAPQDGRDRDPLLALTAADAGLWRPYLNFTLTRYANRVEFWELGGPDNPFSGTLPVDGPARAAPAGDADRYVRLYERAYAEMAGLLTRPYVLIPWNALLDFDARQFPRAALDLRLPAIIKPAQIPAYLDNFRQALAPAGAQTAPAGRDAGRDGPPLFAHVDPLDEAACPHADRLADFAQRLVYARTAAPAGILYDVGGRRTGGGGAGEPDELLLVYRAVVRAIGNATYVGELPVAPGLRAFLFNRGGSGTLVLWNEAGGASEVALDLPLGATPRLTDLMGNLQPLPVHPTTGLTHLAVANTPLLLDQIDPRPLQLTTSFALASGAMPAGAGTVRTELRLTNPYADPIAGTLRVQPPKGWAAEPALIPVAIAPGATLRQPLTVRYPLTEPAGTKPLRGQLTLDAGPGLKAQDLDLTVPVTVTSSQVEMEGFTQMLDNGDVVVQQMITNISNAPVDAQAYVLLPNYPRQQRFVLALPPGQTTIKRFTFPASTFVTPGTDPTPAAIAAALVGKTATLGLRQNDGRNLLTKSIPLD